MSTSVWDWPLASAEGLLTHDQCILLLETDIDTNDDLLKCLPSAASKLQPINIIQDVTPPSLYPDSPLETKPDCSELAADLLMHLENQFKEETTFPNWFEEKVDLPTFYLPEQAPVQHLAVQPPTANVYVAPEPTAELLHEFETVYDAVELTHLTPPQTPPQAASLLLQDYAQQIQEVAVPPYHQLTVTAAPQPQWHDCAPIFTPSSFASVASPGVDYGLKAAQEVVQMDAIGSLTPPLPAALRAGAGSPQHSGDSFSSAPSSPRSSTDEEWSARPKPYSRAADDRRSRKKEQNKNAATRYRQKKKAEVEVLLGEENALRQRHAELATKCTDLQREIRYLKGLMRDLFKAKGLIK